MTDLLWAHFRPLWIDLVDSGGKDLLVAGGYGLFLKQNWLFRNQETPSLVPIAQWTTNEPRVTKDLDLVVSLDVIAEEQSHRGVLSALAKFERCERIDHAIMNHEGSVDSALCWGWFVC